MGTVPDYDATCNITVLRCHPNLKLCKVWEKGLKEPEKRSSAKHFQPEVYNIDGIDKILGLLRWLATQPDRCAIRGAPVPEMVGGMVLRNRRMFVEPREGLRYAALDMEPKALRGESMRDLVESAEKLRRLLPRSLQGVRCVFKASGSARVKKGIRGHLWFAFDKPVHSDRLKALLKKHPVDLSMLRPVSQIFEADPWFEDASEDPFGARESRICVLEGDEYARLPEWEARGTEDGRLEMAQRRLDAMADKLRKVAPGARHETQNKLGYHFVVDCVSTGLIGAELYVETMLGAEQAAKAKPSERRGDDEILVGLRSCVSDGMRDGSGAKSVYRVSGLLMSGQGIARSEANARILIDKSLGGVFAMNDRTGEIVFRRAPPWEGADEGDELSDVALTNLGSYLQAQHGCPDFGRGSLLNAVTASAKLWAFDPWLDYLMDLDPWDGETRIFDLMAAMKLKDAPHHSVCILKFLIGSVARNFEPGAKVDTILILFGPQGIGKSTWLLLMVGLALFDSGGFADKANKDFLMKLGGLVFYEFEELLGLRRQEIESVKAMLSTRVDKYRRPYDKCTESHPRRVAFAGTTNDDTFLADKTGNRRFLPIACSGEKFDFVVLEGLRDQLWAEALYHYRNGMEWWITDSDGAEVLESLGVSRENAEIEDPWEDKIVSYLARPQSNAGGAVFSSFGPVGQDTTMFVEGVRLFTSAGELLEHAIGESGRQSPADSQRIAGILKRLGCVQIRKRQDGYQKRLWEIPEHLRNAINAKFN